jgi:hypothetical protein
MIDDESTLLIQRKHIDAIAIKMNKTEFSQGCKA